jgi:NTP pyrophosphatase (non-canonical NTP hydrolase)
MAYKEQEIIEWATDRGILGIGGKGTPSRQHHKTLEEVQELTDALVARNIAEVQDAIGDIYVTLVIQASMQGLTMAQCIDAAYDVISKRTGKMVNGQFVKDAK